MSFGIPVRNGLGVGLLSYATSLARRGGAAVPPLAGFQYGYNMPGMNYYVPGGILTDWGKNVNVTNTPGKVFIPPVKGTFNIQTNTGVTLSNFSAGMTITSSNSSTGQHTIVVPAYLTPSNAVNNSGAAITRFTVTKPGWSNKISEEFITGTRGKWLRNLDMDYTNAVPIVGSNSPPRPSPTDYFYPENNGTGVGSVVPYQDMADGIAALKAYNPSFVGLWDVLGVDLNDTDITNRATYQRDNIPANVLIALELGNELYWNLGFSGVARQMIDGVRNGYYGAATASSPQPTKTVAFGIEGYLPTVNTSAPAMTTGQLIGCQDYESIGTCIWRALRTVSAGSRIFEGADFTLEFGYAACVEAGRRWYAVRHNQIIEIYRTVFGEARFQAQIVPVIMGQDTTDLVASTLIQRTFVPGYFAKVKGVGCSHYLFDDTGGGNYATTANGIEAAFRANLPARISRMTTDVAAINGLGKVFMSYEGMTHPINFGAYIANTSGYKTAWDSLFASAAGQTLMTDIAFAMRQVLNGPACGFSGITAPPYGLFVNWDDTSNKRLVGWTTGIAKLAPLTTSGVLRIGTAASGTIGNSLMGSTVTSNIPGITINNSVFPPTYSGTPTGSAGTISNGLVETLTGSVNSPNNSSITTLPVLPTFVLIKTTGTFTVPANFPGTGIVHCIGAGGRGINSLDNFQTVHGGGGGAYARQSVSLTANQVINVQVGTEGSQIDTWLLNSSTVLAKAGANATLAALGAGGTASASIGTTKFDGGAGGLCGGFYYGGGGGGGSAGPDGAGKAGGPISGSFPGGGGGSNGGSSTVGGSGSFTTEVIGGAGGAGSLGTGGGSGGTPSAAATAGTNGGGGGGGGQTFWNGANGGMQGYWTQTSNSELAGPSGGGGGAYARGSGGTGGGSTGYGGGSGGSIGASPIAAAPGLIVLEYTP